MASCMVCSGAEEAVPGAGAAPPCAIAPPTGAELSEKVSLVRAAVPSSTSIPPPTPLPTLLPAKRPSIMVRFVPASASSPPPPPAPEAPADALRLTVLFFNWRLPGPRTAMPPPAAAELPLTVTPSRAAAPLPLIPPPTAPAVLPVKEVPAAVRLPPSNT